MVAYIVDQSLAAARNHQIDLSHGLQQGGRRLAPGRHQRDAMLVETVFAQYVPDQLGNGGIRVAGIASALQYASASGLQAKREHVEAYVRPGLVNHADHAERNGHFPDFHAVWPHPLVERQPQRRRQRGHVAHVGRNTGNPLRSELQSVVHRIGRILARQILAVGRENIVRSALRRIGYGEQHPVDPFRLDPVQPARSLDGPFEKRFRFHMLCFA